MEEILQEYNEVGREETGYVVIDVRGRDEVEATGGVLSPNAYTIPVQEIDQALSMDSEDFLETYGFAKPDPEETIVFSCLSGMRAKMAAQSAASMGFQNLVVYVGGAKEWFGL